MSGDRSWMRRRVLNHILNPEFVEGVNEFLQFAFANEQFVYEGKIKCPCNKCKLWRFGTKEEVKYHLFSKGFTLEYTRWDQHGEMSQNHRVNRNDMYERDGPSNPWRDFVTDAGGFQYDLNQEDTRPEYPNPAAQKFYSLLREAEEPLLGGSEKTTKLSTMMRILNLKSRFMIPEAGTTEILRIVNSVLPEGTVLPKNYYHLKQHMKALGLGYEKIDACLNDCVLYYGEHRSLHECPTCNHPRYKSTRKNLVPYKVLRYFPLTPRLQRLFYSNKTAEYMRWHASRVHNEMEEEPVMVHPADGVAWKHFDRTFPEFAAEVENVRLGLATDGFSPFGVSSKTYSC
ncbi:Transposase_21 domain-containing protein/Pkinase_Tyr domain-containing protein/Transpos_assoc domain-containing protein, partial [Cephalotus follicularis]